MQEASAPAFAELMDSSLSGYLTRCGRADGFLLFHHLPKTAGSSAISELTRFGGHRLILNDHEMMKAGRFREHFDPQVRETIAGARAGRYRSASGHLRARSVRLMRRELPGLRVVTLLREPTARYLSDYFYQHDSKHPHSAEFRECYPTLAAYVEAPWTHNKMADFLHGLDGFDADPAEHEAIVGSILGGHTFIGLFESYPLFVDLLARLCGQSDRKPALHINRRDKSEDDTAIDPGLLREIRDRNRLDHTLYEAVQAIWHERHLEWIELRRQAG